MPRVTQSHWALVSVNQGFTRSRGCSGRRGSTGPARVSSAREAGVGRALSGPRTRPRRGDGKAPSSARFPSTREVSQEKRFSGEGAVPGTEPRGCVTHTLQKHLLCPCTCHLRLPNCHVAGGRKPPSPRLQWRPDTRGRVATSPGGVRAPSTPPPQRPTPPPGPAEDSWPGPRG